MNDKLKKRSDGAALLDSGSFVTMKIPNGFFYQECCRCGMTHKVHIRNHKELTIRFEQIEAIPNGAILTDHIRRAC